MGLMELDFENPILNQAADQLGPGFLLRQVSWIFWFINQDFFTYNFRGNLINENWKSLDAQFAYLSNFFKTYTELVELWPIM